MICLRWIFIRNPSIFYPSVMQRLCSCKSILTNIVLLWIPAIFIPVFTVSIAADNDFYCENGVTIHINLNENTTGTVHTLLQGETYYGNNRFCQWVLDAGSDNNRIYLTILETELQYTSENTLCIGGHDYVHVKDGIESSTSTIALWCGSRNPYTMASTGRYLTITFQSDHHSPYKYIGAHIKFQAFDSNSCAPEWTSPMTSDPYCYKVMTHSQTWTRGQMFCNYNQANLVIISSEDQQDYIQELGQASLDRESTAWLGLSKIASESTLEWINETEATLQYFPTQDHKTDEDCVLIDIDSGEWQTQHCSRFSAPFVCQTNKWGKTTIYPVPEGRKEVESQSNIAIILAGVLGSLVVVAGIITAILVYLLCFAKKNRERRQQSYRSCGNDTRSEQPSSNRPERNPQPTQNHTNPRSQPSAPYERDPEGTQLMFTGPSSIMAPPTYHEAIGYKGPVDVP